MESFKRYIIFVIGWYYPEGGIGDAETSFDSRQEAMDYYNAIVFREYNSITVQVFDCQERILIAEKSSKN